ncbi:MAG: hypothetical protein DBX47_00920 [Clostridiales bacterium]|nr:MAG: hypothetical protein DBX47_00920 [Clostridiales bacterium]
MKTKVISVCLLLVFLLSACTVHDKRKKIIIAENGHTYYTIKADIENNNIQLAAEKLKTFIDGVSGSDISYNGSGNIINLITDQTLDSGTYSVCISNGEIKINAQDTLNLYMAVDEFIDDLRRTSEGSAVELYDTYTINKKYTPLDNSSLLPEYRTPDKVTLEKTYYRGKDNSPDWISELSIVEMRVETATEEGTFDAAKAVLERLSELGINAVWLCPIYEGEYGNKGPQSINPKLTGTSDYKEGWKKAAEFVEYAHSLNIRVFFDVITWGVWTNSPLITEHPDWFTGIGSWGGYDYNWGNPEMKEWFISEVVSIIEKTNADGFRCDLEPGQTGYKIYEEIRKRIYEKGYKIAIFSEGTNYRSNVYDFEQIGVSVNVGEYLSNPQTPYINADPASVIKKGQAINSYAANARYNTYCLSMHDFTSTIVHKNRLLMGFSAIFMPNIPLWFLGEEYGTEATGTLYYSVKQDLNLLQNAENYAFYNDIKKYLSIKYTYPDIFCEYSLKFTENNVCTVMAEGSGDMGAFARYSDKRAVMIVPNADKENVLGKINVTLPYDNMQINTENVRVIDLMKDKVVYEGPLSDFNSFTAYVEYSEIGIYLVEEI